MRKPLAVGLVATSDTVAAVSYTATTENEE